MILGAGFILGILSLYGLRFALHRFARYRAQRIVRTRFDKLRCQEFDAEVDKWRAQHVR